MKHSLQRVLEQVRVEGIVYPRTIVEVRGPFRDEVCHNTSALRWSADTKHGHGKLPAYANRARATIRVKNVPAVRHGRTTYSQV